MHDVSGSGPGRRVQVTGTEVAGGCKEGRAKRFFVFLSFSVAPVLHSDALTGQLDG